MSSLNNEMILAMIPVKENNIKKQLYMYQNLSWHVTPKASMTQSLVL